MATLTSSSSSSPRCVPFAFRRGGERRARGLPAPAAAGARAAGPAPAAAGCGRPLCRAAEAVGGGIRGAFFASLDRCSCVEVRTKHDDDSFRMVDGAAAEAAPLMRDGAASGEDDTANANAGGMARGWRRAPAAAGKGGNSKQRRGGLVGCCDANSTRTVN